ncbi:MAG: exodeoxyribonuclease III [bacterium]|nr:exodeoxyribonuclease III [bacterium]
METLTILSWNVNGIRAVQKKGFLDWLQKAKPDVLLLQETKAEREQLDEELLHPNGYHSFWTHSERKKGYSGTAIYSRYLPSKISAGIGVEKLDSEGRTLVAEFGDLVIFNIYFPNGKASPERLKFKMEFYEAFQKRAEAEVKKGKKVLVGGDVNTAHHPIDLARPQENVDISGFLPVERAWMDRFEAAGFHDSFRVFHPDKKDAYSWWSMRSGARARNVGWRIDYFYCSDRLKKDVTGAFILPDIGGSDHCPVGVRVEVPKTALNNKETNDPQQLSGTVGVQGRML